MGGSARPTQIHNNATRPLSFTRDPDPGGRSSAHYNREVYQTSPRLGYTQNKETKSEAPGPTPLHPKLVSVRALATARPVTFNNSTSATSSPRDRPFRALHVFPGRSYKKDRLAAHLNSLGWECDDIYLVNISHPGDQRSNHDLLDDELWLVITKAIHDGEYDFVWLGTPCASSVQPGGRSYQGTPTPLDH